MDMIQRISAVLIATVFLLVTIGLAGAGSNGNSRKGKYLYRKTCRACHKEGATGDRVGKPLSPISKTQADWQKVFDEHKNLPCNDQWEKLSEKDLKDIYAYLYGHAFDSPSPAKCK